MFLSDLEDGATHTLGRFADGMKLDRVADALEGPAAIQRGLDRLKEHRAVQPGEVQSPAPGKEQPQASGRAGGCLAGKQLCRKGLKGPGGH